MAESNIILIIVSLVFIVAVYFSFMLSKETKHEKYWLFLALGFFIFATHHWSMMLTEIIEERIQFFLEQATSIVGSLLIAYSTYGLYKSMKKINEKTK